MFSVVWANSRNILRKIFHTVEEVPFSQCYGPMNASSWRNGFHCPSYRPRNLAYLDELELEVLGHLVILTHAENVSDDVFRRISHEPKMWQHFVGLVNVSGGAGLEHFTDQQWVRFITHLRVRRRQLNPKLEGPSAPGDCQRQLLMNSGQDKWRAFNYWAKGLDTRCDIAILRAVVLERVDRRCNITCNIDGVATKVCKQGNQIG